jgi:hypothetical protein
MFIPLLGKTGTVLNGDIFLGILLGFFVGLYLRIPIMNPFQHKFVCDFYHGIPNCNKFANAIFTVFIFCTLLTCVFQYSSYNILRPKRLWIHHLERDMTALHEGKDSGLWVVGFDGLGLSPLSKNAISPNLDGRYSTSSFRGTWLEYRQYGIPGSQFVEASFDTHRKGFNCGVMDGECYLYWPYYFPAAEALRDAYYIPSNAPKFDGNIEEESEKKFDFDVTSTTSTDSTRKINMILTGPTHLAVIIRDGASGTRILKWGWQQISNENLKSKLITSNLEYSDPDPVRLDGVHFIQVGFGGCVGSCIFRMELLVQGNKEIEISAYGHYVLMRSTEELKKLASDLPDWSVGAEWTYFVSKVVATRI